MDEVHPTRKALHDDDSFSGPSRTVDGRIPLCDGLGPGQSLCLCMLSPRLIGLRRFLDLSIGLAGCDPVSGELAEGSTCGDDILRSAGLPA
jgi:hypothetical protein